MIDLSKIYTSKNYGDFKIIKYVDSMNVTIKFVDTGYISIAQSSQIRGGQVKDRLLVTFFGVGFVGAGRHKISINRVVTNSYTTWRNMLERCYCTNIRKRNSSYADCTVAKEWHNFQVFAEWFELNYIDGYHLDKDIKIKGNRVYSPEACMFVTPTENNVEAHAKHFKFISPNGELVCGYNLSEFCRDNGLTRANMDKVSLGKRNHHKQWRKAPT